MLGKGPIGQNKQFPIVPTSKGEIRLSEWDPASVELLPAFCDIVVGAEENKDHEYDELDKHCCALLSVSLMQSENTNQLVTKLLSTMCTANCEGPDLMYCSAIAADCK